MDLRESRLNAIRPGARHPWELARLEVVTRLLNQRPRGAQRATGFPRVVLDIGCGDAFVAEQLSHRYPETHFVAVDTELEDETLAALGERLSHRSISFFRTLQEAVQAEAAKADVVLLLDVIEHIEDDVGFLAGLRACPLITSETLFVITVPAYQRLFYSHDVFLGHFRRYDRALLESHLRRAGYQIEQSGAFFLGPLLLRTLQVWRERNAASKEAIGLAGWRGGAAATRLLRLLLLLDFSCSRILRRLGVSLPGLSQYALCTTSAS